MEDQNNNSFIPESTNNQPIHPKSNINLLVILLLTLIVAVVFGLVGYYLGKQAEKQTSNTQMPTTIQPSPTSIVQFFPSPSFAKEKKIYSASWYSFEYPQSLFTINTNDDSSTFYQSLQEAKDADKCNIDKLGTVDHPCGEYMVFNVGVSKNPLDYQYSLKSSLSINDPSLLKPNGWTDINNREWLLEGPVEIPGGSNLRAEYEDGQNLYQVSIQVGKWGFERFSGETLSNASQLKASEEILNSFIFSALSCENIPELTGYQYCDNETDYRFKYILTPDSAKIEHVSSFSISPNKEWMFVVRFSDWYVENGGAPDESALTMFDVKNSKAYELFSRIYFPNYTEESWSEDGKGIVFTAGNSAMPDILGDPDMFAVVYCTTSCKVLAEDAGPAGIGGDSAYFVNGKIHYTGMNGKAVEIPFN